MSGPPRFRTDLYRGTSADYDRFRLPYPPELYEDLHRRTTPAGHGRLLDLACGPGTVTFALCDRFAEVWAVDQEPDAIDFAMAKADALGTRNIRWMVGRAEDVDPQEVFELVTVGNAFHRLDRRRVAGLAREWLRTGGHLALLWSSTPLNGTAPWQRELTETVVGWMERLGTRERVPADLEQHLAQHPHARVLEDAGLTFLGHHEFVQRHDWTVESLAGFMYSTSLLPRVVLGDQAGEFERDVRERLHAIDPSGVYTEEVSFAYDLACGPTEPSRAVPS